MTAEMAEAANESWGFNCGPAAICAALNLTPDGIRKRLIGFERRRYMNPTQMVEVLEDLGQMFRLAYRQDEPLGVPKVINGIVRIQFGGDWTRALVPKKARYPHTHWTAWRMRDGKQFVYDINAQASDNADGWWEFEDWCALMRHMQDGVKGADGTFWPTHVYELIADEQ